jgi:hypothetical protein
MLIQAEECAQNLQIVPSEESALQVVTSSVPRALCQKVMSSAAMRQLTGRTLRCFASLRSGFAHGGSSGHGLSCSARRATPQTAREYRSSLVVYMGRRSAKIANRKVSVSSPTR